MAKNNPKLMANTKSQSQEAPRILSRKNHDKYAPIAYHLQTNKQQKENLKRSPRWGRSDIIMLYI